MNQILSPNQVVDIPATNGQCTIKTFLGGGGQGEVYMADWDGKRVAVKWYFPHAATEEQRNILVELIRRGSPDDRFLWPMAIVTDSTAGGFGYIMPLRDSKYKSLFDLMARRISPSFKALATAGAYTADSFLQLHSMGLCYRDISFGNLFFNPDSGEVLICDNDNVSVDGSENSGVIGTPDFMAPEIVRGEDKPCTQTDLFSLAVLLFYMLHTHHPLYGKRILNIHSLDLPARRKLCGDEPLFIFHPTDKSNEALPRAQDSTGEAGDNAIQFWNIYPQFLRDLFTRAFTDGLRPGNRVRESEWRLAMSRLRDTLVYCEKCGNENFYDEYIRKIKSGVSPTCWGPNCNATLRLPFRMRLGNQVIMLNHNTELYPHHLDNQAKIEFTNPIGKLNRHPKKKDVWGLTNLTESKWICTGSDNKAKEVEKGQTISLDEGIKINFGPAVGEVKYAV